jgi:hypothetical protein
MGQRARPGVGFGQGPQVRGGRRPGEQRLGERARDTLVGGHEAQAAGRHGDAAAAFEKIALVCRERAMFRSATWLRCLAATNRARSGDAKASVAALEGALRDARSNAEPLHSARVFGELLANLAGTPLEPAVPDLERAIREAVGTPPKPPGGADVNRNLKRTLPEACETCASAVDPERARLTEDGADCPVCGAGL